METQRSPGIHVERKRAGAQLAETAFGLMELRVLVFFSLLFWILNPELLSYGSTKQMPGFSRSVRWLLRRSGWRRWKSRPSGEVWV